MLLAIVVLSLLGAFLITCVYTCYCKKKKHTIQSGWFDEKAVAADEDGGRGEVFRAKG